ncbi:MAG: selenide, water dikinase SelD [Candidatus Marinimicrobia bacterium]|nr:selenide, water dikinase SelD [Candidatus Neomarinimicrobiota bacterium]
MKPIYLDHNASTPLDPEVITRMRQVLENNFGNPSSAHVYGLESKKLVEEARDQVALLINCEPEEIVFTSGGSESNNMAITGIADSFPGCHLITTAIEHPSVEKVFNRLSEKNYRVTIVPVDHHGIVNITDIEKNIHENTRLISVMLANNETGVIQPVQKIVEIAHRHNILVHTDAAQAVGKIKVDVRELSVDLMTIAAHKMNGPKGIGALYIRKGVKIPPMILGADHESGLRAGTENVLEIVGLGVAAQIFHYNSENIILKQKELRDAFVQLLKSTIPSIQINGDVKNKLPNTANIYFPGLNANTILAKIPEIAASAGAACHATSILPSSVLKAMGCSDERALGSIRFSLGRRTDHEEIKFAVERLAEVCQELRPKTNDMDKGKISLREAALGCSCKLSPEGLNNILRKIAKSNLEPTMTIGFENSDDASVYYLDDQQAILNTVDFFSPIVEDPFDFGRIAAANALSDIYAMGGTPLFANNIVQYPEANLPADLLVEILNGAQSVAEEARIPILGGHSVKDDNIKYGLSVTGIVKREQIWQNSGARAGDKLVITKPIGTGILCEALKNNLLEDKEKANLIDVMARLNQEAAEIMKKYPITSCTDVTGFGLMGHLSEMMEASALTAIVRYDHVPVLGEAKKIARLGMIGEGYRGNLEFFEKYVDWSDKVDNIYKKLFFDPQTSGGLLFTIDEKHDQGLCQTHPGLFTILGEITERKNKLIVVV